MLYFGTAAVSNDRDAFWVLVEIIRV